MYADDFVIMSPSVAGVLYMDADNDSYLWLNTNAETEIFTRDTPGVRAEVSDYVLSPPC